MKCCNKSWNIFKKFIKSVQKSDNAWISNKYTEIYISANKTIISKEWTDRQLREELHFTIQHVNAGRLCECRHMHTVPAKRSRPSWTRYFRSYNEENTELNEDVNHMLVTIYVNTELKGINYQLVAMVIKPMDMAYHCNEIIRHS